MPDLRTITVNGEDSPSATGGEGPDLLWLHGEGNTSGWREVHDRLAERFTVHAPTLPGFGGTPLPEWLDDMDDLALWTADACVALGLEHPVVVGESLGGWLALTSAIWRPALPVALVLVGPLGLRPAEPAPDLFIKAAPEALGYLSERIDAAAVDPMTGDIDAATALWVEQATQARLMWERPYDRRLERRLHHVSCPRCVVWGAVDRLLPVEHGARLAAALGAAPPTVVAGAGHLVSIDDPVAVADATTALATTAGVLDGGNR
ncbi:MAG: alpha/beta hydrolase [Acidimicrobiia bacterium]|nr:alpha/beta hydrolase [Acidimicrobiia bacterium]